MRQETHMEASASLVNEAVLAALWLAGEMAMGLGGRPELPPRYPVRAVRRTCESVLFWLRRSICRA